MAAFVIQRQNWVVVCKAYIMNCLVFSTRLLIPDQEKRDHAQSSIQHNRNTQEIPTEGKMEGGTGR